MLQLHLSNNRLGKSSKAGNCHRFYRSYSFTFMPCHLVWHIQTKDKDSWENTTQKYQQTKLPDYNSKWIYLIQGWLETNLRIYYDISVFICYNGNYINLWIKITFHFLLAISKLLAIVWCIWLITSISHFCSTFYQKDE